jgi:hypothetical protein
VDNQNSKNPRKVVRTLKKEEVVAKAGSAESLEGASTELVMSTIPLSRNGERRAQRRRKKD